MGLSGAELRAAYLEWLDGKDIAWDAYLREHPETDKDSLKAEVCALLDEGHIVGTMNSPWGADIPPRVTRRHF